VNHDMGKFTYEDFKWETTSTTMMNILFKIFNLYPDLSHLKNIGRDLCRAMITYTQSDLTIYEIGIKDFWFIIR